MQLLPLKSGAQFSAGFRSLQREVPTFKIAIQLPSLLSPSVTACRYTHVCVSLKVL